MAAEKPDGPRHLGERGCGYQEGNAESEGIAEREESAKAGAAFAEGEGEDDAEGGAEAGGPAEPEHDPEQRCAGEPDRRQTAEPQLTPAQMSPAKTRPMRMARTPTTRVMRVW